LQINAKDKDDVSATHAFTVANEQEKAEWIKALEEAIELHQKSLTKG
jgi:hypothetical protein